MADLKEKIKEFPDTQKGKHFMFWLSLVAVSFAVIGGLKSITK